jgi:phage terminase small subunit
MARPRKPTAELELKGSFAHDSQRRRFDPPTTGKLPAEAPEHMGLDDFETAAWREVVELIPSAVNAGNDLVLVEVLARMVGEMRRTRKVSASQASMLKQLLNTVGMTPSGRASLATPTPPSDSDPLDEFVPRAAPRLSASNAEN